MPWPYLLDLFERELLSNLVRYAVVAGAFFLVFGVLDVRRQRRIQQQGPPGSRMLAEVPASTPISASEARPTSC